MDKRVDFKMEIRHTCWYDILGSWGAEYAGKIVQEMVGQLQDIIHLYNINAHEAMSFTRPETIQAHHFAQKQKIILK